MRTVQPAATPTRTPLIVVLLVLPGVLVAGSWLMLRGSLPDTLATHWSGASLPDGFSATVPTYIACQAITAGGALLGLAGLITRGLGWRAGLLFAGGLAAWCAAAGWLASAITTHQAGDPRQAVLGAWALLLVGAALLGIVPVALSGSFATLSRASEHQRATRIARGRGKPLPPPLPEPARPLRTAVNGPWWIWLLGLAMLPLIGWLGWLMLLEPEQGSGQVIGLLLGPGLLLLTLPLLLGLCRITVQVDRQGLWVGSWLFGFTLRRIRLEMIEQVDSEHIEPVQWGGWGWRFFPGGSAVVFKATRGLVVYTTDGRRFAVTMHDSEIFRDRLLALQAHGQR